MPKQANIHRRIYVGALITLLFAASTVQAVEALTAPENAATQTLDPKSIRIRAGANQEPARVRIPLVLTPFRKVVGRERDGAIREHFVRDLPIRQTLRAKAERSNHFFFGDWHVETVPQKWVRKTGSYEMRLNVFRRYGVYGQLEEKVGQVDVAGLLSGNANLFNLVANTEKKLVDAEERPVVEIRAGFARDSQEGQALVLRTLPETKDIAR